MKRSESILTLVLIVLTFFGNVAQAAIAEDGFHSHVQKGRQLIQIQAYDLALDEILKGLEIAESEGVDSNRVTALCILSEIDYLTMRDEQSWEHAVKAEEIARKRGHLQTSVFRMI